MSSAAYLPINSVLQDKYRIEKILGQGGFGITYQARHELLGKKVAVKELFLAGFCRRSSNGQTVRPLRSDFEYFKTRFLEEARVLAKFSNKKGIVQVNDIFAENDTVYFVMDFVEGESLGAWVRRKGTFLETEAAQYALQILEALQPVHAEGIIHRDIKPDNLLLRSEDKQLILIDFGIAREFTENETLTQTAMHSKGYAPPEQYVPKAKRTASMDLYSVGGVLYFCLTGQRPQTTDEVVMDGYISARHISRNVSPAMNALIDKALQKRPTERFQSCEEMMGELREFLKAKQQPKVEVKPRVQRPKVQQPVVREEKKEVKKAEPSKEASSGLWLPVFAVLIIIGMYLWQPWKKTTSSESSTTQKAPAKSKDDHTVTQHPNSYTESFMNISFRMIYVEGGTFQMGDTFGDGSDDEKPVHNVSLDSYYMGETEVTQALWKEIMGNNPSHFKNCDQCPVETVSWEDAQEFINKLNLRTGKKYRLPTEAEWEYAARERGRKVRFGNGQDILRPSEANFDARADYKKDYSVAGEYRGKTMPVRSFRPNSLGMYDMSGNVREWCSDWYDENYYMTRPSRNPRGAYSGTRRVLRGGSWSDNPQIARIVARGGNPPASRYSSLGFRLAASAQ